MCRTVEDFWRLVHMMAERHSIAHWERGRARRHESDREVETTRRRRRRRRRGGKKRRVGAELESGWGLLLWPDVRLSGLLQQGSAWICTFSAETLWIYTHRWNVRAAQEEVQSVCQRGEGCRCGFDQGRLLFLHFGSNDAKLFGVIIQPAPQ